MKDEAKNCCATHSAMIAPTRIWGTMIKVAFYPVYRHPFRSLATGCFGFRGANIESCRKRVRHYELSCVSHQDIKQVASQLYTHTRSLETRGHELRRALKDVSGFPFHVFDCPSVIPFLINKFRSQKPRRWQITPCKEWESLIIWLEKPLGPVLRCC